MAVLLGRRDKLLDTRTLIATERGRLNAHQNRTPAKYLYNRDGLNDEYRIIEDEQFIYDPA